MEWDDQEFGVDWKEKAEKLKLKVIPKIQKHQYCAYKNVGFGAYYHRLERIKLFWPEYELHRWAERRLKADCERNWLTWIGPASCVHGDTIIENPITHQRDTIRSLCESETQPIVMTLFGPRLAGVPFVKGFDQLYEVVLENGFKFKATASHRVLTPNGFCVLSEVAIGDVLCGVFPSALGSRFCSHLPLSYDEVRPQSTLESYPLTHFLGAICFRKRVEDYKENYSTYSCPGDGRPLLSLDNVLASVPSPVDALKYTEYVSERSGDSGNRLSDNRFYRRLPLLSSSGSVYRGCPSTLENRLLHALRMRGHVACLCEPSSQSQSENLPAPTSKESFFDSESKNFFYDNYVRRLLDQSYDIKVSEVRVVSITRTEIDIYYDLEVPEAGHYFAEGAIHHNSGKTVDGAVQDLEWWLQAPHESAVILCSTTMKMLKKRIWAAVAHYHQALPKNIGNVGELIDSDTMIRWRAGDALHAIFGIAVEEGPIEEIINNLLGIKARRVRLRIDEGQGIREAILKATTNMSKNPIFQFRMMGNPESMQNPLIRESEPLDGWDSVIRAETEEWETLGGPVVGRGLCQFFDGRKSPADDSPEERKRLPFLINKDHIEAHLKSVKGNLNDPSFWSQCIGWPPAMGLESTLLDDAIITSFHCKDKAVWTEGFRRFASLDPAGTGGDKKMLTFGKFGQTLDSKGIKRWVIECDEQIDVPVDSKSERPIEYQIVDFCKVESEKRGIRPREFSCAAAGAGGPLCSIFDQQWGLINRINEGGTPNEEHIIDETGKTAKEAYDTRASELLFTLREFAMADGIRGLPNKAAFQACSRRTFYRNGKWATEPKVGGKGRTDEKGRPVKGYKERMGHSPDDLDSFCIGVEYCRQQGASPTTVLAPDSYEPEGQYRDEFSDENYMKDYSYV